MITLAELRAAAKAKLAASADAPVTPQPVLAPVVAVMQQPVATPEVSTLESNVKIEAPVNTDKPLTFAEKMALRKASITTESVVHHTIANGVHPTSLTATTKPAINITDNVIPIGAKTSILDMVTSAVAPVYKAAVDESDLQREEYLAAEPKVQEAYKDIKSRINALSPLSEDHLAGAMSELKVALLQNPSACLLMYDEDLGTLASALRRLVHEDLIANTKPAKEPKAPKVKMPAMLQIPITADMLATRFSDL